MFPSQILAEILRNNSKIKCTQDAPGESLIVRLAETGRG